MPSFEDGPRANFATFLDSTPDPVPSPPSPHCVEQLPEPTADGEPKPGEVEEPLKSDRATEQRIAAEPEVQVMSVQVQEPAATPATRGNADISEIAERSSTHCNMTEAPLLTLSPPTVQWARRGSASLNRRYGWRIPCLRLQESRTPAPSSLFSALAIHSLHQAPSSLRLRLGLASTILRLGTPLLRLCLVPLAPSGSSIPSAHLCPLSLQLHHGLPDPRLRAGAIGFNLALRILPVILAHWLSISALGSSTTCSTAFGRPPGVIGPSSSMAPPSVSSTMARHHGCGLGPTWLLLLQVTSVISLAPPSGPPGSSCFLFGSSLRRLHPGLCLSSSSRVSVLLLSLPLLLSTVQGRAFREGGDMSGSWTCFVLFCPCLYSWFSLFGHVPVLV
ncbi:hypothetical protein M9458_053463 [Cirrhinus mrigala]|uniref:Uncharacterized protein n=1 Tax=Cirrhinus mrigala TaxID=683832 RepID=A0ABD0MR80_CIRMR